MKKLLMAMFCLMAFAMAKSQTTQEEYTYVTKTLPKHFTNAEEMHSKYLLKEVETDLIVQWGSVWRSIDIYYLVQKSTSKKKAFVFVLRDSYGNLSCTCVPTRDASAYLWRQTEYDMASKGNEWTLVFMRGLAKISSLNMLK